MFVVPLGAIVLLSQIEKIEEKWSKRVSLFALVGALGVIGHFSFTLRTLWMPVESLLLNLQVVLAIILLLLYLLFGAVLHWKSVNRFVSQLLLLCPLSVCTKCLISLMVQIESESVLSHWLTQYPSMCACICLFSSKCDAPWRPRSLEWCWKEGTIFGVKVVLPWWRQIGSKFADGRKNKGWRSSYRTALGTIILPI